jgi:hypothetical protein
LQHLRSLSFRLFLFATVTSLGACSGDPDLFVAQVAVLDAANQCAAVHVPHAPVPPTGTLDLLYIDEYRRGLLVGTNEGDPVTLTKADVTVLGPGGVELNQFVTPVGGTVPAAGDDAGYRVADVTMIDASTAESLETGVTYFTRVTLFGQTSGGDQLESEVWEFPIKVCRTFLGNEICIPCVEVAAAEPELTPCQLGIDEPMDCRIQNDTCLSEYGAPCR